MLRTVKLKDISKVIGSGITPLRANDKYWKDGIVYWLKTEQLGEHKIYNTSEKISQIALDETSIKIFPVNTLSIAMYGEGRTRGNVSILKNEMTTNQACCNIIIDDEKADYEYVYYNLKTQYHQLRALSSGVRKNLNSNDIKEFKIRLPESLFNQQKIASALSALDSKIELNNRINTELEAMAKTLYDYWFVQFDFPDTNGKPYKTSGGKMVWNEDLKREVPEGWDVNDLSTYLDCNLNTIRGNTELKAIKYLDTSNLTENRIDLVQEIDFQSDAVPSRAQRVVKQNDILFSTVRPNLRHFGIMKNPIKNLIASTGFAILSHKENTSYNDFFYMFITSEPSLKKLEGIAASSVSSYPSINYSDILNLLIALPSKTDVIEALSKKLHSNLLAISSRQDENQKLTELRDWLLPMLMNGQVKVN